MKKYINAGSRRSADITSDEWADMGVDIDNAIWNNLILYCNNHSIPESLLEAEALTNNDRFYPPSYYELIDSMFEIVLDLEQRYNSD